MDHICWWWVYKKREEGSQRKDSGWIQDKTEWEESILLLSKGCDFHHAHHKRTRWRQWELEEAFSIPFTHSIHRNFIQARSLSLCMSVCVMDQLHKGTKAWSWERSNFFLYKMDTTSHTGYSSFFLWTVPDEKKNWCGRDGGPSVKTIWNNLQTEVLPLRWVN